MSNQSIIIKDNFNIHDVIKYKQNSTSSSPFLGLVRIYENGVLNTDETPDGWLLNMTIAKGRQFAAQKLFNKTINQPIPDVSDFYIDSFGIGSGGSSIDIDYNVTLIGPTVCDLDLNQPIAINTAAIANSVGNINIVKLIEEAGPGGDIGSITLEISNNNEYTNCTTYKTVTKCVCIVDNQEPTSLNLGETVKIDEAMLYATNAALIPAPTTKQSIPFAHICFAPKFIEKESVFTIEWYVIF